MQIQHEVQLLESGLISKGEDLSNLVVLNQTLDSYTLCHQQTRFSIEHLVSNPVNSTIAVYLSNSNQITLIDTKTHQKRERFPLKACDKKFSKKSFALKGFDFSPDGSRLAIGQSDCIIYIYKLFTTNNQQQQSSLDSSIVSTSSNSLKPTITGKFACSSPITCLIWSELGIIFGTQDGKIKLISLGSKSGSIISGTEISNQVVSGVGTSSTPLQSGPVISTIATTATSTAVSSSTSTSSVQAAKVINIYTAPKGSMPLALSYKSSYSSMLAVSLADNSILLLTLPVEFTSPSSLSTVLPLSGDLITSTTDSIGRSNAINSGNINSGVQINFNRRNSNFPTSFVSSVEHTCPAYYLSIIQNNTLCCAGSDGKVSLYSIQQQQQQQQNSDNYIAGNSVKTLNINLIQSIDLKEEVLALDYSTINETLALASKSKLLFVKYHQESNSWQLQNSFIQITNVYSLTSLIWTKEGSQLIVGTSIGTLELFKCSWNKQTVSDQLEICHIAKNRVRVTDRARNLLATYKTQHDIKRVNILNNNQSVIIWTSRSILLARLGYSNQSEIQWNGDKKIKFSFEYQDFVIIYTNSTKEILLVRLGDDYIVFKIKFDPLDYNLVSVRQYPSISLLSHTTDNQITTIADSKLSPTSNRQRSAGSARSRHSSYGNLASEINQNEPALNISPTDAINNTKIDHETLEERLAYVQESISIIVINLKNKTKVYGKNHSHKVVWLELSCTNKQLVFKDSQKKLYLANISSSTKVPNLNDSHETPKLLLENCIFAKWLFESNILIAQSEYKIFIWFDIGSNSKSIIIDSRSFNINNAPPLIDLSCSKVIKTTTTKEECSIKKSYPTIIKTTCDQLILSNSYPIQLDKTKVKFYTEILSQRLDKAYEVLEREQDYKKTISLFNKLGWLSIQQDDCNIALKVFKYLNYKSMVDYLEKCNQVPEEKEWRLAILRGDWNSFEKLVDSSQVVATYKRLNKWSRAIDFLDRSQQFRQRDIVEQEFKDWLINKGQFKKAAEIQVKTGDLASALELLIENRTIVDAVDLFVSEQKVSLAKSRLQTQTEMKLLELAKKLKVQLIESGNYSKAALLCNKLLSEQEEALKLYLQAEDYLAAIDLAKSKKENTTVRQEQLSSVQLAFGEHLMKQFKANRLSKRKALPAIDYYTASGNLIEALKASIELEEFFKAFEIIKRVNKSDSAPENSKLDFGEYSLKVGDYLLNFPTSDNHNQKMAIEVYLIGKQYEKVIDLYIKEGDFKEAFELSLKFKNSNSKNDTIEEFSQLAEKKCVGGQIEEAEKIYLMLDKPDKAIETLKEAKMFDRMLELVEQYYPDSLESNLLLLARQFESEGKFQDAEKYLLQASQSEWVNVVRMYRLNGRWDDAFRVAKKYCNSDKDPLLIQLAYWWSKDKAKTTSEAYLLLKELNLFSQVIEFCCENKNFQFAIDICSNNQVNQPELNHLKRDLVKKFASYLEEQHKFNQAEQVLLDNDQIEEATQMYVDNEMYSDAIRIIESKLEDQELGKDLRENLVDLLNKTLVLCANRISGEVKASSSKNFSIVKPVSRGLKSEVLEKLQIAQQMYLRAQKPELAVELYKERGMWQEAIQVAQRFAPQLLESVEQELDSQVERDVDEIMLSTGGGRSSVGNNVDNQRSASNMSSTRSGSRSSINTNNVNDELDYSVSRSYDQTVNGPSKTVDYLRNQADTLMKNGDTQGAKQALEKFIESLIDGTKSRHQGEATLALLSKQLYQIEREIIKRRQGAEESFKELDEEISRQLMEIANDIGRTCLFETSLLTNQQQSSDERLVIWIRLRNILSDYLLIISEQQHRETTVCSNNNGLDVGLDEESSPASSNFKQQLRRRLLVAHYITLHGAYVIQLQINLGQQQQRQIQQTQQTQQTQQKQQEQGNIILSPSNAEQYFKSLLGNSNNGSGGSSGMGNSRLSKQAMLLGSSNGQILVCLAKLSLSLLRYTDILEVRNSFYIAGLWLLAAGWRDWAYFVWSRLIEMCELATNRGDPELKNGSSPNTSSNSVGSKFELELKRAGIPNLDYTSKWSQNKKKISYPGNKVEGRPISDVILDEQKLNEVRAWLLECLLERDGSGAISRLVLDERGHFECSLAAPPGSYENITPCLLCGYPVRLNLSSKSGRDDNSLHLNQSKTATTVLDLQVHLNEWNNMQLIAKRSNDSLRTEKSGRSEWEHLQRLTLVGGVSSPSSSLLLNQVKHQAKRPVISLKEVIDFLLRLSNSNEATSAIAGDH